MTLSAKEKVFKIRQAEYEIQKLKKDLNTNSPKSKSFGYSNISNIREGRDGPLNHIMGMDRGNHRINFGGPARGPVQRELLLTRKNFASLSSMIALNVNKQLSLSKMKTHQKPSHHSLLPGFQKFPNSPYAQPVIPPNHKIQMHQNHASKKVNQAKVTKIVFKHQNHYQSQSISHAHATKNAVEQTKTLKKGPFQNVQTKASMISTLSGLKEQPQGRMFRHRYNFQESVEPSPLTSQAPSALFETTGFPKIASTGLENGIKESIDNVRAIKSPLDSCRTSREQLCLPSPIQQGPASWIKKKFPNIVNDLMSWKEHNQLMKPMKEVMYPGKLVRKSVSRPRAPSPELSKDQPLPHQRGLIGIEIMEFDAEWAVFYRDRKGTYNPHLLPKLGESNAKQATKKTPIEVVEESKEKPKFD